MSLTFSLVVAMTPKRVIGNKGELPWKALPSDIQHLKRITMEAGTVIMGRKTWESIPEKFRPLPGRKNIVLTKGLIPSSLPGGVHFVTSVQEACEKAAMLGTHACVTGGEEIYRLFLMIPDLVKAYVTTVYVPDIVGDAHFPKLESGPNSQWQHVRGESFDRCRRDPKDAHDTSLDVYERISIV